MLHSINICSFVLSLRSFRKSPRCGGVETCTHFWKRLRLRRISKKLLHDNLWVCVCKMCCEGENFTRLPSGSHQKHTHQMCAEKKKEIIHGSCSFSSSSSFEGETKRCGNGDRAMMMMTLVGCFTRSQIRCADGKCGTHRTCTLTLTHKTENERAQEQASEWL